MKFQQIFGQFFKFTKYEKQCEIITFYTEVLTRKVQNWEEKPQINFFFSQKFSAEISY